MMKNLRRPSGGFTLIEAVVATALFAFIVSSILGVYISVLRLDARTRAQRSVTEDGRFIMDFLAKEIRNGQVDYVSYPGQLTCGNNCGTAEYATDLYLINQNNEHERLFFRNRASGAEQANADCRASGMTCDLYLTKNGVNTRLNSEKVSVTYLKFLAAPWGDPFTAARNYNQQPAVTVVMELKSIASAKDPVKINLESTFSSMVYPARP